MQEFILKRNLIIFKFEPNNLNLEFLVNICTIITIEKNIQNRSFFTDSSNVIEHNSSHENEKWKEGKGNLKFSWQLYKENGDKIENESKYIM